ncbi:hypothetical protein [Streptomyces camelliae]|uniref:Uncharacterized protein n=1 Tax=Streptomyces camelliae TaxID=3004093 RepID=A0ABY7P2K5_9ACTN|nr:hypothetical protein [Streptomyces sp. HUAS 2-6]WBO64748.1 hypothetical protein O1G22_18845 [Streptomyces sp. HUAS 2-6]
MVRPRDDTHRVVAEQLVADLDVRLHGIARLRSGFPAAVAYGGERESRRAWLHRERAAWRAVQEQLADVCLEFAIRTGGLDEAFGDTEWPAPPTAGTPGGTCPYCACPVERRTHRLPALSRDRDRLVCWGCDVLYEGPSGHDPLVVDGPFDVRAGGTASYRIAPDSAPRLDAVRFGIVRVPWGLDVAASPSPPPHRTGGEGPGRDWDLRVGDGPPGLYALVMTAVAAGEVFLAKRPIDVRPSHEPDGLPRVEEGGS